MYLPSDVFVFAFLFIPVNKTGVCVCVCVCVCVFVCTTQTTRENMIHMMPFRPRYAHVDGLTIDTANVHERITRLELDLNGRIVQLEAQVLVTRVCLDMLRKHCACMPREVAQVACSRNA